MTDIDVDITSATRSANKEGVIPTRIRSLDEVTVGESAAQHWSPIDCAYDRSVSDALNTMNTNNITSLPIFAPEGVIPTDPNQLVVRTHGKHYIGIVSMLDVCIYLLTNLGNTDALSQPIWQAVGRSTEGLTMVISPPRSSIRSLLGMFATGNIHRVLVPIQNAEDSVEIDYRMLTQTDLVKFMLRELDTIARPVARRSLENLGLVNIAKPVFSVSESMPTREALRMMQSQRVRSVCVVDFSGVITTSLNVEDVRGLTPSTVGNLDMSVLDFTRMVRGSKEPAVTCAPDWSLAALMAHMVVHGVHRVWIVDPSLRPIGVISQTDILNVFATSPLTA